MAHWSEMGLLPNSPAALRAKQEAMRAADLAEDVNRSKYFTELCRNKRILDIGCGGHDIGLMDSPGWLHGQLANVAASCMGLEQNDQAVAEMRARGLDVENVDICALDAALPFAGDFEVVVAGEVIEHLSSPQALFEFAAVALRRGGELVISTPNPYAPWRVRRGRRHELWENLDHVVYAFPSGILELAARTGFDLVELGTTTAQADPWRSLRIAVTAPLRRFKGGRGDDVGVLGAYYPSRYISPLEAFLIRAQRGSFLGETAVYRLRRG